ncbi:hypothetical protein BDZ89DRAFT_1213716 [Hymenopellis radicata]|nr:hypothetical protein BDZ89DRAFT_1213716 [Hymenopellis radicata]
MGMELCNTPCYLSAVYAIEIVKDNPKERTIHFGGIKGQAIYQRYMDMTYDTIGNTWYTFSHPDGLLYAIQFAQIALVVTEKAAFEDLRSKGYIQRSLVTPLASTRIVDTFPVVSLDVVRAVERDAQTRAKYVMCAVNSSRVSKTFTVNADVDAISNVTGLLFQILAAKFTEDEVKETLGEIVQSSYEKPDTQQKAQGYIRLERGFATIPLAAIDVPFHSRYLWAGVIPFRIFYFILCQTIPNRIVKPIEVTKEYTQIIYDQTTSPVLDKAPKKWEDWDS